MYKQKVHTLASRRFVFISTTNTFLHLKRPREPPNVEMMADVAKCVDVPVIANGGSTDISSYEDAQKWKDKTGCSSIMLARCAQSNLSVFRKEGLLSCREVAKEYLKLCIQYDNRHANTKFCLLKLMSSRDPLSEVCTMSIQCPYTHMHILCKVNNSSGGFTVL
eukprot:m.198271 g.198271  ORF g.198271 m.198271 type:complete len:164 (-) comp13685_c3_seq14:1144-1635(-)